MASGVHAHTHTKIPTTKQKWFQETRWVQACSRRAPGLKKKEARNKILALVYTKEFGKK